MKRDWPVRETWRASFIFGVLISSTVAFADARALVVEARTQDPARLLAWTQTLAKGAPDERAAAAFAIGQLGMAWEPPAEEVRAAAERALVGALATEKAAAVRDRVVEGLGKVGGKSALAPLTALLDGDERARGRGAGDDRQKQEAHR
jgi:HEAT repeat protein